MMKTSRTKAIKLAGESRALTNFAPALAGAAALLSGCSTAAPSAKQYKMATT